MDADQSIKLIVFPVKNIEASKAIFRTFLGVDPYTDMPYYVGFRIGDQEIGLDPNAHTNNITVPISFVEVRDINSSLDALIRSGTTQKQAIKDVGGGKLIATVSDVDGNILGLIQQP